MFYFLLHPSSVQCFTLYDLGVVPGGTELYLKRFNLMTGLRILECVILPFVIYEKN